MDNNKSLITSQQPRSALAVMASRYNVEPNKLLETLKGTVFKNATNEQLLALVVVANEYQLNPFTRQIYAFPDKAGGITPVVSVDGWIGLMNRQESFDGIEFEHLDSADGKPVSCTAIIFLKGRTRAVKVTEYFAECQRNTEPWRTCPRRMLRHKALIQGARIAFGFAGIHDEDEAETFTVEKNITPSKPIFMSLPTIPAPENNPPPMEASEPAEEPVQPATPAAEKTVQQHLAEYLGEAGVSFDDFRDWLESTGRMKDASALASFDEVPTVVCEAVKSDARSLAKVVKLYGKAV